MSPTPETPTYTPQPVSPEIWEEHVAQWKHCARCPLVDVRLLTDKDRRKDPYAVPMGGTYKAAAEGGPPTPFPFAIMVGYPHVLHQRAGHIWGVPSQWDDPQSPAYQHGCPFPPRVLLNFETNLQLYTPFELPWPARSIPMLSALGCRPLNHKDYSQVLASPASAVNACGARWKAELRMIDPCLIVAAGHHAFVAVSPREVKKEQFHRAIGEIRIFDVPGRYGPVRYCAYIAPDIHDTVADARMQEEWSTPFSGTCPSEPSREPVAYLRWHLYRAAWLARALELARGSSSLGDFQTPDAFNWTQMLVGANERATVDVRGSLEILNARVDMMSAIERSERSVTRALAGEIEVTRKDLPSVDDFEVIKAASRRRLDALEHLLAKGDDNSGDSG